MEVSFLLFITLLISSIVVSQAFSYIIALADIQKKLQAPAYIELRQLTDSNFRRKYPYVVYASLLCHTLLLAWSGMNMQSLLFVMAALAWLCTIADTLLTVKGNLPINNRINTWQPTQYPADWHLYRDRWLKIFRWRQLAMITGFIALLIAALFA